MKRPLHMLGGPNLGRLGSREPEIYGTTTWDELVTACRGWAADVGYDLAAAQTDGEGQLVGLIHKASDEAAGVILNAAAYTHTSVAVRDAVAACAVPVVEVHLSQYAAREPFRRTNLLADVCRASLSGFGTLGYRFAVEGLAALLADDPDR
jgi:3-dehydroquinate dehydratase-2